MNEISICLDVGGTYVKGMVFDQNRESLLSQIQQYDAHSEATAEEIINNLSKIIFDLAQSLLDKNYIITFIGLAFPGPFDYENGISYIKELGKYESLYGLTVKSLLIDKIKEYGADKVSITDIFFINDATAFALGENYSSKANSGAYFTIGTGLGSTFIKEGKPVKGQSGLPQNGMVYNESFKESIIDDYISSRGLTELSKVYYYRPLNGKELYDNASSGDGKAIQVFEEFGQQIGAALQPFIKRFQPDEIVFGGQISNSFEYFYPSMREYFPKGCKIRFTNDTSYSVLTGLLNIQEEN